jgi:hypothetical protein
VTGIEKIHETSISLFDLRIWLANIGGVIAKHSQVILSFDNLEIVKTKGLVARLDSLRGKVSLQWSDIEGVILPNNNVQIMDISLRVPDLKKPCAIHSEISAEDFTTIEHEYQFHNSYISLAQVEELDGRKLNITLDYLEELNDRLTTKVKKPDNKSFS